MFLICLEQQFTSCCFQHMYSVKMESDYDYLFKIVLIGDAGVGKTSIVRRYCDGVFTSAGIPTIGVDFCIKTIKIGGDSIKV